MVISRQPSLTSMRRDAWVEVDLGAIERNVKVVLSWLAPGTKLMAVVKSDAYGHGAQAVAPVLVGAGASFLGVASIDEGLQLREAGIKAPILILSPCPFWGLASALSANLDLTVTAIEQVEDIAEAAARAGRVARVHAKVDTGMHRLGERPDRFNQLAAAISACDRLEFAGVFSHLARADDAATTSAQNEVFKGVLAGLASIEANPGLIHLASGEAARRFPDCHYDMVRVGLYLFGLEPRIASNVVAPALSVRARINHILEIEAGESVGYNHTWTAPGPARLASIPIGYADGVDRGLSNRMSGLLAGRTIRQVGLISMDQMLFDVTDLPDCQVGDIITLIGSDSSLPAGGQASGSLTLADWAVALDTITYELASRLRVRLPRIYTRSRASGAETGSRQED